MGFDVRVDILCHGRGAVEMRAAARSLSDECVPLCWALRDRAGQVCLVVFEVLTKQETTCWQLAKRMLYRQQCGCWILL